MDHDEERDDISCVLLVLMSSLRSRSLTCVEVLALVVLSQNDTKDEVDVLASW